MKPAYKSRKSLANTPVQKTTLLNFFQRTPVPSRDFTNNHATSPSKIPAQEVATSAASSPSKSLAVYPLSTPCRVRFDSTQTECPGCGRTVPVYRLNDHLDSECLSSSVQLKLVNPTKSKELSTPVKKMNVRIFNSASKITEIRQVEIAKRYSERKTSTDIKTKLTLTQQKEASIVKRNLFPSEDSNPKYEVPYYLETFLFLLKSTFEEPLNSHLLDHEDHKTYQAFLALSSPAKQLYVRLFSRKFQWRRRQKIAYPDISRDLTAPLRELCDSSFLLSVDYLEDLSEAFRMLSQPELKLLFKETKLPFNGKANSLEIFMKHCRNQPCAMQSQSSSITMAERMVQKIKRQYLTECYMLKEDVRRILLRLMMLSTLHQRPEEEEEKGQQQQSFNMLQVTIGQKTYPGYRINRKRPIFQHREDFLSYSEAMLLELKVREPFDRKDWQSVLDLTEGVPIAVQDRDRELPVFLRRFTACAVRLHVLDKRVDALQTLKRHQDAVDLLSQLILQDCYLLNHRGYWYERLALNVEQHLKDPHKAMDIIKNALNDEWVTPAHRLALSQRATRICQSKLKLESLLKDLPLLVPAEPPCVVITGRSIPTDGVSGRKSTFIRGDSQVNAEGGEVTLCSVEELVLQHYAEEGGYTEGVHGEGSTLWTVVALLFWDVIYLSDVPDVFLSPFQATPLDLDSPDFYPSRQAEIEQRLESVKRWSDDQLAEWIEGVWKENHGRTSLVSWDRFRDWEHLDGLVRCIPPHVLASVSERLLRNYRHYRSGFPDLIVWNPEEKKWRVVEVKGPNDRLSTKQTLWLNFLVSLGVEAEVCHVQAVGTKRMGATPQPVVRRSTKSVQKSTVQPEEEEGKSLPTVKTMRKTKSVTQSNQELDEETAAWRTPARRSKRIKVDEVLDEDSD